MDKPRRQQANKRWPHSRLPLYALVLGAGAALFGLLELGSVRLITGTVVVGGMILVHRIFTQRASLAETERAGAYKHHRLNTLLTYSSDVTLILDTDGRIRYASPSVEPLFGWSTSELERTPYTDLAHPEDRDEVRALLQQAASEEDPAPHSHEWRLRNAGGEWRYVEGLFTDRRSEQGIEGLLLNMRDVTERKNLERKLSHQALHDPLTGLANRSLLIDRARHALEQAARRSDDVALLFLDLDDLKRVNDTLGHSEGDKLLIEVAMRLQGECRAGDTVARMGGDEFAVLLEQNGDAATAEQVAGRILEDLSRPYPILKGHIPISVSMGVSIAEGGLESAEELLRTADVAMYSAKREGKNTFRFFSNDMVRAADRRLHLESELRTALPKRQFVLHYQPIVSLAEERVVGVEALLRWEHPKLGLLTPGHFLHLLEETNLIVPVGRETLSTACREVAGWGGSPGRPPIVFVNISATELLAPHLVPSVQAVLQDNGLPASNLVLEITEDTLVDDKNIVQDALASLREIGVRLAIDDFGSGYSSLCYLRDFPVHMLKLAQPFVTALPESQEARDMVQAVLDLARAVDLDVIAEGVEANEQHRELTAMSCSMGQGYFYLPPRPPEEVRILWEDSVRLDELVTPVRLDEPSRRSA